MTAIRIPQQPPRNGEVRESADGTRWLYADGAWLEVWWWGAKPDRGSQSKGILTAPYDRRRDPIPVRVYGYRASIPDAADDAVDPAPIVPSSTAHPIRAAISAYWLERRALFLARSQRR